MLYCSDIGVHMWARCRTTTEWDRHCAQQQGVAHQLNAGLAVLGTDALDSQQVSNPMWLGCRAVAHSDREVAQAQCYTP